MRKQLFLMLMMICTLCPNLYAAPALQRFVDIEQPDGTTFKAQQKGDEFQHWTETKSGHTILRNPKTKYWDYAEQSADGKLKASGYRAMEQGLAPSHLPPRLKPPRNKALEEYKKKSLNKVYQQRLQRAPSLFSSSPTTSVRRAAPSGGDWAPEPVEGERKLLVVRIKFSDRPIMLTTPDDLYKTVFSLSSTDNAVARYYAENSFSKFRITPAEYAQSSSPEAVGIITVSITYNHPYPLGDSDPGETYASEPDIINLALEQAAMDVDFSSFDANGDGTLDPSELTIYFIYAGYEAAGSGKTPNVWAHANGGSGVTTGEGGLNVTDWAISGELNDNTLQQGMGIIAHELGHTLCGLPDLYDPSGTNAGMGIFSLMAYGLWGAESGAEGGTTPTNLDLWSREYVGWATPSEPVSGDRLSIYSSLFAADSGYKLFNPLRANEYYLLEYRRPSGWDLGAKSDATLDADWQGGLLLTHIDTSVGSVVANTINDSSATGGKQRVSPVQANKERCDMASDFSCWGNLGTLFYSGNNADWSSITTPNSNYYDGTATNFTLSAISAPGETITTDWSTTPIILLPVIDNFERSTLTDTAALSIPLLWETKTSPLGIDNWTLTASGDNVGNAAEAPLSLSHNESATMETTVITGDGNLSFWYKVDSEIGDKLTFSIDGIQKRFWEGEVNWSRAFYPLTAGEHRLTWTYTKDTGDDPVITGFTGVDSAWIDDLSFAPGYRLNIAMEGVGLGDIAPDSGTVNWVGTTGAAFYNDGKVVKLTANANLNSLFNGWGGDCSGTATTCEITMDATKNVTATFIDSPAPIVTTRPASAISPSGATLNAIVNANNSNTIGDISFEYGLTTGYGTTIAATPSTATGTTDTAVSVTLTDLTAPQTYHFRVVATNSSGTSTGEDVSFSVLFDQTIIFGTAPALTYGGATASVSATGGASGQPVIFNSLTSDVCTITGTTVTPITAGLCTIEASQAGTSDFNPAPTVTQNITVAKATPVITWAAPADIIYGTSLSATQLNANAGEVSGSFVYTPLAGTVLNAGLLQPLTATFTPADTVNYNTPATATVKINVSMAGQAIIFGTAPDLTYGGAAANVSATGGTSGQPVTFNSQTGDVCTISGATVTPITAGLCTIEANQVGTSNFTPAPTVIQTITVAKVTPVITWTTPADMIYGTALSATQLTANSNGISGTFVYSPSAGSVLNSGNHTLTATFTPTDTVNYSTPAPATVSINIAVTGQAITFGPAPALTYGGASASVSATGGDSGQPVTFSSLTSGVCTISGTTVTPVNAGLCTIEANQTGDSNYNYTAALPVTQSFAVAKATPLITWTNPAEIVYGTALSATQLNASSNGVSGTFVYAPSVGSVLNSGTQALTATFIPANTANYNMPSQVAVEINVSVAGQAITFGTAPVLTYGGATASVNATGGASGQSVTFSSLTSGVCTISGTTVTPVTAGTCTIAANQLGNANYNAAPQATQDITVTKATPVITWTNPTDIVYGTALSATQLNAVSNGVSGTFIYAPTAGTVLNAGTLQALTATFTPTDTVNYSTPAPATVTISVTVAGQTIIFGTAPDLTYGGATVSVSATGGASGQPVTFSSLTSSVCSISGTTITPITAGLCTIEASQAGTSNFTPAPTVTQSITVAKATPIITWAPPADIIYGTALSVTQLNASSNGVSGTFVYAPSVGSVLNSGAQALTATFFPAANANYNIPSQVAVPINVSLAGQAITFGTAPDLTYGGTANVSANGGASGQPVTFSSLTSDVCTISGTTVTALTAGTCTIAANQLGNANYYAAPQAIQDISVTKATPIITWTNPTDIVYGTALSATQLNASSNGVSGTFVYAPTAGTVLNAGALQALNATFTPTDTANYNTPTPATVAINVAAEEQAITFGTAPALTYGGTSASVSATGGASGQPMTFTSLTSGVCTISGTTVTPVNAGTCTIAANQLGNANYNAAPQAIQDITVTKATPIITWANPSDIVYGTALSATQLNANSTGVNGTFIYAPTAGTVLNAGTLQVLTATFTPTDTANYSTPAPATVEINVSTAGQTIIFGTTPDLTYGGTASVSANGGESGQPVTFNSQTGGVCTISGATVTPLTAGTCIIAANQAGNADYSAAPQALQNITVTKATPVITWTNPADIVYGTALSATQLTANSNGISGTFVYSPSAGSVLNSGNHMLTATFTPTDTANYSTPASATVAINVVAAEQTITFGTAPVLTYGGASASVSASGGESGQPVTFSSLTSDVCTISGTTVTPLTAGTCTIAANQLGNANYNAAPQVIQDISVTKGTPVITWTNPADIVYGTALSATQLTANSNGISGTFVYSPSAGSVLNSGNHTLTATFTPTDTANYSTPASATVAINVSTAGQSIVSITFSPESLAVNGTTEASATATSGLTVVLTSTTPTVCTISGTTVTGLAAGACTIVANQGGDASYNAAPPVTQDIPVDRSDQSIGMITFLPVSLAVNGTTKVSATATSGLAVTWTSSTPSVCTVNDSSVTSHTAGTCTIVANQGGDDSYNAAPPVTQDIPVDRADQSITAISFAPASLSVNGTTEASSTSTSGLTVTWTSTTPNTCTVSDSTVTGLAAGTCTIVANQDGDANYSAAPSVTQDIPVDKAGQTIGTLTFLPVSLAVNDTTEASATATSELIVTWTTTTPSVCTVNGSTVTGLAAGTCTIVANQTGDANYNAAPPVTQDIPVEKADQTITAISFSPVSLAVNGSTEASATATSGLTVTWSSTTPETCMVSGSTVTGIAAGTCTIVANQIGDATSNAALPVTQNITVSKAYGDIDDNGFTEPADALLALQMAIGKKLVNNDLILVADVAPLVDGIPRPDGKITSADAWLILRKAVGL